MRSGSQYVSFGSDNDGQNRNEVDWFRTRGDLDNYRWTFGKNSNFCAFSSNFNNFVSWETVHMLCGLEFVFVRKHTASFWRSFKL